MYHKLTLTQNRVVYHRHLWVLLVVVRLLTTIRFVMLWLASINKIIFMCNHVMWKCSCTIRFISSMIGQFLTCDFTIHKSSYRLPAKRDFIKAIYGQQLQITAKQICMTTQPTSTGYNGSGVDDKQTQTTFQCDRSVNSVNSIQLVCLKYCTYFAPIQDNCCLYDLCCVTARHAR